MPSPTNASFVEPVNLPASLVKPGPAKTMVLQHEKLTISVSSNEPSPAAVESFRSALYPLMMRIVDPS
jgi:hypothetical protein